MKRHHLKELRHLPRLRKYRKVIRDRDAQAHIAWAEALLTDQTLGSP